MSRPPSSANRQGEGGAGGPSSSRDTPGPLVGSSTASADDASTSLHNSLAVMQYQPPYQYSAPPNDMDDFEFNQPDASPPDQQYADFPQIDLAARLVEEMQNNQQYQYKQTSSEQGNTYQQTYQQHPDQHQQPQQQRQLQSLQQQQQQQAKTPEFLEKLRTMLDNPADEGIEWSANGSSFLVTDTDKFGKKVLPNYFKHNKWTSFVRQLNIYGFHKVPNLEQGTQNSAIHGKVEIVEYRNDHFHRDHPELMQSLQRKPKTGSGAGKEDELPIPNAGALTASHSAAQRSASGAKNAQDDDVTALLKSNNVWRAVQAIQRAQQNINSDLDFLKTSTSDLWREATRSRERSRRQQDTMNKILRFLAGVFGAQDLGPNVERDNAGVNTDSTEDENARQTVSGMGKGRLLITDSAAGHKRDEDEHIEEVSRNPGSSRFTEAGSADSSPRSRSPQLSSTGRFSAIRSPESRFNEISSPRFAESATPTPGGSRRLSQQQSNQIIHALTSEEGSAWLASLFGQGNSAGSSQDGHASLNADSPSPAVTPGGGFKVDPQTMAALQTVLSSGAHSGQNDYFNPATPTQSSLPAADSDANNNKRSSTSSSSGNRNALIPFDAATDGRELLARSTPPPSNPDQQALALSLPRASQGLQHSSDNAASVQEGIAALVESLRLDPATLNSLLQQQQSNNANGSSLPAQSSRSRTPSSRTSSGRSNAVSGGPSTSGMDAIDPDSFLDQFLNIGTPGASSESGQLCKGEQSGGIGAPFAMSPASASRFLETLGDDDPEVQRMRLEDAEEGDTQATADMHARAQASAERNRNEILRSDSPPSGSTGGDESPVTSLSSVGEDEAVVPSKSAGRSSAGAKRKHPDTTTGTVTDGESSNRKRKATVTVVETENIGSGRPLRRNVGGRS